MVFDIGLQPSPKKIQALGLAFTCARVWVRILCEHTCGGTVSYRTSHVRGVSEYESILIAFAW